MNIPRRMRELLWVEAVTVRGASMAMAHLSDFLRRLTRGLAKETLRDQSDRRLVEQALLGQDEAAFQTMLQRHGAMVYRVCWRVLQHSQDTEDAFQATFLVLARKLPTLRRHDSLASWLHGVAYRVALKARARAALRRRHEQQTPLVHVLPPDDVTWRELRSALDAELEQLPDEWRLPLILCYLEGQTQDEAAAQLGWSKSTLRRRLERARAALGRRLTRRGIVWPAALSALMVTDCVTSAPPAPALVTRVAEATAAVASGQTVAATADATVTALVEGALTLMVRRKLKAAATASLVLLGAVALGTVLILHYSGAAGALPGQAKEDTERPRAALPAKKKDEPRIGHQTFTVSGRGLDRDGKPVAEATMYLVSTNNSPARLLATTTTDAQGRYTFRDAQLPYSLEKNEQTWLSGTFQVFGKAPEHAYGWAGMKFLNIDPRYAAQKERAGPNSYFPGDRIELDVPFAPRYKVEGQIVNEKGAPIAGVKLRIGSCDSIDPTGQQAHDNFREFRAIYQAVKIMPEQVTAVTDGKGRFAFPFVPADAFCWLLLEHPDYAGMALYTATTANPPAVYDEGHPVLRLPLQLTLQSVRTITVQVRSREGDQPVAGIRVFGYQKRATGTSADGTSDPTGKATLKLPPGKYQLVGDPPRESNYVRTRQELIVEPMPAEQAVILRQQLGCILILKALDADTGKGVARVTFWQAFDEGVRQGRRSVQSSTVWVDNPVTNDKGELRAVVQPGTGRYGVGFGPLPEGYAWDDRDITEGRELELPAGKTVTATFPLRKQR
jgi:RNA polymerase sigma factor (sigma-70 family)